jgi:hypothetical protein
MEMNWTKEDILVLEKFLSNLYDAVGEEGYELIYEELYNNPPQGLVAPHLITESTEKEMQLFLENIQRKVGNKTYFKFEKFLFNWNPN